MHLVAGLHLGSVGSLPNPPSWIKGGKEKGEGERSGKGKKERGRIPSV